MSVKGELQFVGVVEKAGEQEAKVRISPESCSGLKSIGDFSHLIIPYWMHLRKKEEETRTLLVFPRKHTINVEKGVFACRSPSRPNPIGLCVMELIRVEEHSIIVKGLDAYGDSPIIDIKPYIPRADSVPNAHVPDWTLEGSTT